MENNQPQFRPQIDLNITTEEVDSNMEIIDLNLLDFTTDFMENQNFEHLETDTFQIDLEEDRPQVAATFNNNIEIEDDQQIDNQSNFAITQECSWLIGIWRNIMQTANNQISTTEEDVSGSLIGFTRATLDEIYDLYCQHAFLVGFSVRKSTVRVKQGTDIITEKQFESTTEESTKKKTRRKRRIAITRTECCALIRAKLNNQGQYEIIHHSLAHNPLTRQQRNHLHRSERTMTREKGGLIETMQESGLRPMESYRYMITKAGGEDYIGHTIRDHLNYCNRLKMKPIEGGDAQAVIDKLYQNMSDDLEFFFRARVDGYGRVSSIFWRDSMMKEDYNIYGDAMGDKCPTTIFTDQDTAMTKAIEKADLEH
ncbi:Protein FAR1-RELATED SEQUENCE 5 [Bienertia sinuspersici]